MLKGKHNFINVWGLLNVKTNVVDVFSRIYDTNDPSLLSELNSFE